MFHNTCDSIIFKKKIPSVNGQYKFQVTELYLLDGKDLDVTYELILPEKEVGFIENQIGYWLDITPYAFSQLEAKARELNCEIYIYPKFGH